ncbi:AAA family ATPase [Streptomyces sp. bgisy091]|uniref:AAA family ATPase n=1 Tax=Streptomyces sp. bgisy091 TaxID=3413778 RepID=UPI003D756B87
MAIEVSALVSALEIQGLFGHKYLHIDMDDSGAGARKGRRLSLLYGNNGSGKTTALKLLWHALSPADTEGHRNEIARTPFESFTIYLCRGDVIKFTKDEKLGNGFTVVVTNGEKRLAEQVYRETPDGRVKAVSLHTKHSALHVRNQRALFELETEVPESLISDEYAREVYLRIQGMTETRPDDFVKYLKQLGTGPYMLADDRKIYGDDIEGKHRNRKRRATFDDLHEQEATAVSGVPAELNTALRRAYEMIQRMVITGNVSGSRGSNNVYLGILEKISQTDSSEADATTREKLRERLDEIVDKTAEYSTYGLMPTIRRESFSEVLNRTPDSKLGVAEDVMQPFIEAQQARLDALSGVAKLLSTLTREVNRFFQSSGKKVRYRMHEGLKVYSEEGNRLQPEDLSSGERQILLLLLNTVLARESTRLFLIDEPELSLNVKWQRQLMHALLALTEGAPVQFVVATHSIEVITGHRDALAKVAPRSMDS